MYFSASLGPVVNINLALVGNHRLPYGHLSDFFDNACQRVGVDKFFDSHANQVLRPDLAQFGTLGIAAPQIQIFKNGSRQADLMNKLYSGKIGFHIIPACETIRTSQHPAVLHREAVLQLIFECDAAVAIVTVLAAVPVLPAILKAFEYKTIRIFTHQLRRNFLVAAF